MPEVDWVGKNNVKKPIFLVFTPKFPDFGPKTPFEWKIMQASINSYSYAGLRTNFYIIIDL